MKKVNLKTTTNSKEYKILLMKKLSDEERLCPMCPPNKGCNSWKKPRDLRNWKNYRKTQYKNGKE